MKHVGIWDGRGLWICVFHQFPGLQQPGAPAAFPAALFLCALSCVLQAAAPQSPVFAQKLRESLPGVLCPLTGIYSGIITAEGRISVFSCSPLWLAEGFQSLLSHVAQTSRNKCLSKGLSGDTSTKLYFLPNFIIFMSCDTAERFWGGSG